MNKKLFQPIFYALVLIIGILLGQNFVINYSNLGVFDFFSKNGEKINTPVAYQSNNKINAILNFIEENYVDDFSIEDYEEEIIQSILNQLDPYSTYIPTDDQKIEEDLMHGSFGGIGIEFSILNDSLVVISAISGGPSKKLGIKSGDRIIEVNGENIASIGMTNTDVVTKLRGEKGTKVEIKIYRRDHSKLLNFTIVRGDIPLNSIDASLMISDQTGYVKINRFSATTNDEFDNATRELLLNGMNKLILDLRDNPGGYLDAAIYICDQFLKKGELILYTKGKHFKKEEVWSTSQGNLKNIELTVLINEGSASASEIVSGCMQDLDRALIIGRKSVGKGLVQREVKLNDGSAIRLTTQKYYIPSGRSIQTPYHIREENKNTDTFIDSLQYTTKNGRIVYGGGGITPDFIIQKDTNDYRKINIMIINDWIREFSMSYNDLVDVKRGFISIDKNHIYARFKKFVIKKDKSFDFNMKDEIIERLKIIISANIAKNAWGNNAYYTILLQDDQYINKAKEILKKNNE